MEMMASSALGRLSMIECNGFCRRFEAFPLLQHFNELVSWSVPWSECLISTMGVLRKTFVSTRRLRRRRSGGNKSSGTRVCSRNRSQGCSERKTSCRRNKGAILIKRIFRRQNFCNSQINHSLGGTRVQTERLDLRSPEDATRTRSAKVNYFHESQNIIWIVFSPTAADRIKVFRRTHTSSGSTAETTMPVSLSVTFRLTRISGASLPGMRSIMYSIKWNYFRKLCYTNTIRLFCERQQKKTLRRRFRYNRLGESEPLCQPTEVNYVVYVSKSIYCVKLCAHFAGNINFGALSNHFYSMALIFWYFRISYSFAAMQK